MCPKCYEDSPCGYSKAVPVMEDKINADGLCSSSIPKDAMISNLSTISETSVPGYVYKRRKLQRKSDAIVSKETLEEMNKRGQWHSAKHSACPPVSEKKPSVGCSSKLQMFTNRESAIQSVMVPHISDLEPLNESVILEEHGPDEASTVRTHKLIDVDSVNDSCSSKSNTELVSTSTKAEVDETGECSSSSVTLIEGRNDDHSSEKDICISIIRSQGLLERTCSTPAHALADTLCHSNGSNPCLCRTCGRLGTAMKMLICDHCDEAFHLLCCHPRVNKIPEDDWLCPSCLKKRHIVVKRTTTKKSAKNISEISRGKNASAVDDSNPIVLMLKDKEPYSTSVRVGKGFQADVPEWAGPQKSEIDNLEEPQVIDPSEYACLHDFSSNKPSRLSSIGNWLQCRQVVYDAEGVNETICGKWRRAPLFEVQTDNWECFCSVFWDPGHADCAVPQELEMDEVLKQLKYIQMLRPRIAASRRKFVSSKSEFPREQSDNSTHV